MKKIYMQPTANAICFTTEGMLAGSKTIQKCNSGTNGASEALSNDKIWDNDLWGTANKD